MIVSFFACINAHAQIITTFAGCGSTSCGVGDGGPATAAATNADCGGTFDKYGNFYFSEIIGCRVRKVTPAGIISTVIGTGSCGFSGDNGPATAADINEPITVLLDTAGNIYLDDGGNFRIRKVDAATGIISTIAGNGTGGFSGEEVPATDAQVWGVNDMCFDKLGNLYFTDQYNYRVRKITPSGIISTIAGTGVLTATGSGDGGPATAATFNLLQGIAANDSGDVYVCDYNAGTVREINTSGVITTVAGNGTLTYDGDNVSALHAQISPVRLTFDLSQNLVIGDELNHRVYKIDNADIIHCIAGNGMSGYNGDGELATAASLDYPAGLTYDTCGNLYISESTNRRVRKVSFNPTCLPLSLAETTTSEITIYPNPATSELNVNNITTATNYALFNVTGIIEQSGTLKEGSNTISIKSLPPGLHILELTDDEGKKTVKKIVKQ